jgi:hypothetical protein
MECQRTKRTLSAIAGRIAPTPKGSNALSAVPGGFRCLSANAKQNALVQPSCTLPLTLLAFCLCLPRPAVMHPHLPLCVNLTLSQFLALSRLFPEVSLLCLLCDD